MKKSCTNLADECLELIFTRLHEKDLEAVSLVCKQFLSVSSCLQERLTISDGTLSVLPALLRRFPLLKTIKVNKKFNGNVENLLRQIAQSGLNHLESLDICFLKRPPLHGFTELGSLKSLNCSGIVCLLDLDLVVIANSLPWLEEISISYEGRSNVDKSIYVTDQGIEAMAVRLKDLRKIFLWNLQISDQSLVTLSSNCVKLSVMTVLYCSDITVRGLYHVMKNSPNLCLHSLSSDRKGKAVNFVPMRKLVNHDPKCVDKIDCHFFPIERHQRPLKFLKILDCHGLTLDGIPKLLHSSRSRVEKLPLRGRVLASDLIADLSQYVHNLAHVNLIGRPNFTKLKFSIFAKCPCFVNTGIGVELEISRTYPKDLRKLKVILG